VGDVGVTDIMFPECDILSLWLRKTFHHTRNLSSCVNLEQFVYLKDCLGYVNE